MATTFRWLLRIFSGLVMVSIFLVALAYWLASRSLPDYDADFTVAGVSDSVEIVRDNANVPHIFGSADTDVFYGLGFAHAQDRLWQMMTMRRTAQGRLSELFGRRTLQIDDVMRRLDIYNAAVRSVAVQDPATTAALQAYADGVNAWLAQVNEGALGRGAPEYFLFSNEIAPWQPADSIALVKLMAVQLSGGIANEVIYARTSLLIPQDRVRDILPDSPGAGVAALPAYAALAPGVSQFAMGQTQPQDPLSPFNPRTLSGASNAWAAAPSRSATGSTLLANDPHLGLTAPSPIYLARMELASGGVIGATIPGIPVIMMGRSQVFGWGLTSSYLDDQDVYIEQVNPENPNEVMTPTGYKPMRSRTSIIRIKDDAPVTINLQWTENGPVLPGTHYNLATITPPGHITSLAWTALSDKDTSLSAAMALMGSQSIQDALNTTRDYIAPAQNLIMADKTDIAMKSIGAIPRRSANHQSQGRMPSPGWLPQNRWQGVMNPSANPQFVSPGGGILGNTNNKIVDRPFPLHLSYVWGDTQRIERWSRLMQNREVHTRESFIEAQLDTVSFTARSLLPLIAADLWFTGDSAPEGTPERQRQRALALLADWNGDMNEHLPEPLIYSAWVRALQDRLIRDELGPLARQYTHVQPLFIERVFRDIDGASVWCDVLQSAAVETCTEISRQALNDALIWVGENYGTALESLRWGDAHVATHDHPVLGQIPILKYFVNIRHSTSGGDNTLMRGRISGKDPDPFQNVQAAVYRGVYDFADPDSSVFISSTGQSGHPLSRFYDDMGELWRRGEYIPMSLDPALARAAAVGVTTLTPAPN